MCGLQLRCLRRQVVGGGRGMVTFAGVGTYPVLYILTQYLSVAVGQSQPSEIKASRVDGDK